MLLPLLCKRLLPTARAPLIAYRAMSIKQLPSGAYPTMITPFLDDEKKSVDWDTLDILTEWYIRSGVGGIFSVCLSSEMFQLSNEERVAIAKRVAEKAAGRVPVVAGATFEGGLEEQARLMNEMGKFVDVVVIITNQIARMDESDEVWLGNCKKLMEVTGDLPLGLYETPVPQARWLTLEMIRWVAGTGRFVFHKDTSLQVDTMLSKLRAAQSVPNTPLKFFTAKAQFISTCVDNGGGGFSGVTANFYPWVVSWLSGQTEGEKRDKVQQQVSITDRVIAHKYPMSSKVYLSTLYNVPIKTVCRINDAVLTDQDMLSLKHMKDSMDKLCSEIGITPVPPMNT
ncbi:4-hydroxy-tetrahydrodipicolinate synthase-like [Halichondria panicea]|uniref:4-hydroxy-tetrahydrodipicolinate synthase-like n=1 Tax=Halichondria panicea TaxID=6063 RepID=UPI00312B4F70